MCCADRAASLPARRPAAAAHFLFAAGVERSARIASPYRRQMCSRWNRMLRNSLRSGSSAPRSAPRTLQVVTRAATRQLPRIERQVEIEVAQLNSAAVRTPAAARRARATTPYWSPRTGSRTLSFSSGLTGSQSMSKKRANGEDGPFSSTSRHHALAAGSMPMWFGTKSRIRPRPCGRERRREAVESSSPPSSGLSRCDRRCRSRACCRARAARIGEQ